jgi:antitoxin component YwqK of YwqJK toxin-antitoxin module
MQEPRIEKNFDEACRLHGAYRKWSASSKFLYKEIYYVHGQKDGFYTEYYEETSTKKITGYFKRDRPYGQWKMFYKDGSLHSTFRYNDQGRLEGEYQCFYDRETHQHRRKTLGTYKDGKKIDHWTHFKICGKIDKEMTYVEDQLHGKEIEYRGKSTRISYYDHGKLLGIKPFNSEMTQTTLEYHTQINNNLTFAQNLGHCEQLTY